MSATQRYVKAFVDCVGDLQIDELKRDHVRQFATELSMRLKPASVKLAVKRCAVVVNHYTVEKDLVGVTNPFRSFKVPRGDSDSGEDRRPYTPQEFKALLQLTHRKDSELTLALHLIATTGCRMSEIVSLQRDDVKVTPTGLSIDVHDNADRSLKTKHSRRTIPCIYMPIHSAILERVKTAPNSDSPLFPRWHNKHGQFSNACRRLVDAKVPMDPQAPKGTRVALHSLRHTVAQALKDVQAPLDVVNALLGWSGKGMASHYGGELSMAVKREWLSKAITQIVSQNLVLANDK
jgi:integrase